MQYIDFYNVLNTQTLLPRQVGSCSEENLYIFITSEFGGNFSGSFTFPFLENRFRAFLTIEHDEANRQSVSFQVIDPATYT